MSSDPKLIESLDGQTFTPLSIAAREGNVEVLRILLAAGADVNRTVSPYSVSPVSLAAQANHTEAIKLLVEGGADVNIRPSAAQRKWVTWLQRPCSKPKR